MSEYTWICLNKQDSGYVSGPRYAKILNITNFWRWQGSQHESVKERSEYASIRLDRLGFLGSKYVRILSMQELHRVLNMPEYGWICLNLR